MFGSAVLEAVTGVFFVYLLLSLLCSALVEWIATLLALRSKLLWDTIRDILDDPDGQGMAKELYDHPLISRLGQREWRTGGKPSYVPARVFGLALFDIIGAPDRSVAPAEAFAALRDSIHHLESAQLKRALLILLDEPGADFAQARKNLEVWFDDAMARSSGWYKQKAQMLILLVAAIITLVLNADTAAVANSLSRNAAQRATIAALAEQPGRSGQGAEPPAIEAARLYGELAGLPLPLGWCIRPECFPQKVHQTLGDGVIALIAKLLGLAMTTVAVSLGAPFWFDVLNKFINIRAVGRPPQETEV
jgi:hypothetical protein